MTSETARAKTDDCFFPCFMVRPTRNWFEPGRRENDWVRLRTRSLSVWLANPADKDDRTSTTKNGNQDIANIITPTRSPHTSGVQASYQDNPLPVSRNNREPETREVLYHRKGCIFRQRRRASPFQPYYDLLSKDEAIRNYLADLTTPDKKPSIRFIRDTYRAWVRFLQRLGKPITESSAFMLVQTKKANPNDDTLERAIRLWKAEDTSPNVQKEIAMILGTFRRWSKLSRLDVTIHVTSHHKTTLIPEPILLSIYNDCEERDRDAIDLMNWGAERVGALAKTAPENVHLIESSDLAILNITAQLAKTGVEHPCIIPRALAEKLLDEAQRFGYNCLMPNFVSRWKRITELAKTKYNQNLTSHYFRKRFETRCEKIPSDLVNPNHWIILMGSMPSVGHMPSIYSLLSNHELLDEYEMYIMPRLALTGTDYKPEQSEMEQLKQQNNELKEQILKLTKLLLEPKSS